MFLKNFFTFGARAPPQRLSAAQAAPCAPTKKADCFYQSAL
jgi:hypothetical protein